MNRAIPLFYDTKLQIYSWLLDSIITYPDIKHMLLDFSIPVLHVYFIFYKILFYILYLIPITTILTYYLIYLYRKNES